MKTFKALSALLSYPSHDLQEAIPVIRAILAEGVVTPAAATALEPLLASLESGDLYDLQERYVLLFDRSRTLSLNLFEHIHGESRDRGGAMVDLLETYRAGGFDLAGPELPDHLPVLLEFLSMRPLAEAREILADAGHILIALAERLARRESVYAAVFEGLVKLSSADPAAEEAQARYDESKATGTYTRTPGQTDEESEQLSYLRRQRAALMQQRDQQTLTYGPRHPRLAETQHMIDGLDAQIAQQRQRMVGQLKSERDVNAEKQAQLENQVRELAKSISRTDAAKVQLAALEREATANRELYQQLLSRNKETYELALLPNDNVRIVSAAVAPLVSTRPPMILVAPAVVVLGIIAAIFLVVLMELKSLRRAR